MAEYITECTRCRPPYLPKDAISPVELLQILTAEIENRADASFEADSDLAPTYQEVVYGLHRLLEREQKEAEVQEATNTWRRLAQLIDRSLFWILLCAVTFFTVFLLVIAPTHKLLSKDDDDISGAKGL